MTPTSITQPPTRYVSITKVAKVEKIVEYSFERNERSNVLAIHPTRPLIAYLINIPRMPKAWPSGNDSIHSSSSPSSINGKGTQNQPDLKTVSIRVLDYATRQRCLAKGIYHAQPAECVFTVNSRICSETQVIKLAVVDRLANVYLYDISYFINELTATRIAVIRSPEQTTLPFDFINLVWCPFVPCEDFDDGDGGLRLALSMDTNIEIFAIDRLQGKTGEFKRSKLEGAYKLIKNAHESDISTLSISPDCSTISAGAQDNRVTFFSSDVSEANHRSLHTWEAKVTDGTSISKLFFLDDYPKLLEDSSMKFWGTAFIGTRGGQLLLVDLRTWSVYQRLDIPTESTPNKSFDYRIDSTSRNVVAMNGNQCFIVQIEHQSSAKRSSSGTSSDPTAVLPRISRITSLCNQYGTDLSNCPIYSFVIKHKSENELELFAISASTLERYTINLDSLRTEALEGMPISGNDLERFIQKFDGSVRVQPSNSPLKNDSVANQSDVSLFNSSSTAANQNKPTKTHEFDLISLMNASLHLQNPVTADASTPKQDPPAPPIVPNLSSQPQPKTNDIPVTTAELRPANQVGNLDVALMDRMVEALFSKLNTAFSQGLEEFLQDVKSEVNDLKLKLDSLCRDMRKLQQQQQQQQQQQHSQTPKTPRQK